MTDSPEVRRADRPVRPTAVERITHSALELIAAEGLGAVSMAALARAAGVSRQTLYNHFPDVDSVVAAALAQHDAAALAQLDDSLHLCSGPAGRLAHLVRHFAALGAHAQAHQLEHGLSPAAREGLARHQEAVVDRIRDVLAEGLRGGQFRADLDVPTDAALVHGLLEGVAHAVARSPGSAPTIVEAGIRTLGAAVAAP